MAIRTAWALSSERKLVNISQLDREQQRGKKCNCFCISCGSQLVSKMGEQKADHFAHNSTSNCSIESIQHKLAKAIIAESINEKISTAPKNAPLRSLSNSVKIKTVELERNLHNGQIIADCFVNSDSEPFAIEVFYTNRKDSKHTELYHELGISALEIDVSNMNLLLNREELKQFVLNDAPRRWLKVTDEKIGGASEGVLEESGRIHEEILVEHIDEMVAERDLGAVIAAKGVCGESIYHCTKKICLITVENRIERVGNTFIAKGTVNKGISVDVVFPFGNDHAFDYESPTLVVDLDVWGDHHRQSWHGIGKWIEKLCQEAHVGARKKEERRLRRLQLLKEEITVKEICELYKSSSSLGGFYSLLADKTGLDLSELSFIDNEKIWTNWGCPRAVWRAIVLLVYVLQGKQIECDMFAYNLDMEETFMWKSRFSQSRSKEIYFWLQKHYQELGAKRKGLSYQFYKTKLPKNFSSTMLRLIAS